MVTKEKKRATDKLKNIGTGMKYWITLLAPAHCTTTYIIKNEITTNLNGRTTEVIFLFFSYYHYAYKYTHGF